MSMMPSICLSFSTSDRRSSRFLVSKDMEIVATSCLLIRVFMAWQGLEAPVEVRPQTLTPTPRTGFTVVEWGGAEVG